MVTLRQPTLGYDFGRKTRSCARRVSRKDRSMKAWLPVTLLTGILIGMGTQGTSQIEEDDYGGNSLGSGLSLCVPGDREGRLNR